MVVGNSFAMKKYLRFLLIGAVIATSGWVHHRAGLTFPVPWEDEAIFTWPAKAFAETWQLRTEHLNPDRPVFYHLPGYPVIMGLYFKCVTPTFASARGFSWLLMVTAYLLFLALVRGFQCRIFAEIAISLYFLSENMTIAGNIARPEALMVALVLAGYWMLVKERPWSSVSLLGIACLVHPVGPVFLGLAALVYLRQHGLKIPQPAKQEYGWLVVAMGSVTATVVFLATHWNWVWNDLQVGLNFLPLTWGERLANLSHPRQFIPALVATALPLVAWKMKPSLFLMAMLGWAFWFIPVFRPEMWYSVYTACSYAILTVVLIEIAACYAPAKYRTAASAATWGAVILGAQLQGHITDPRHYPDYMWWRHMTIRTAIPYIQPSDCNTISNALVAASADHPGGYVQFFPGGDGLLFMDRLPANWIPAYHGFLGIRPAAIIFHLSLLTYPGFSESTLAQMDKNGVDLQTPTFSRNETEKWYVHVLDK